MDKVYFHGAVYLAPSVFGFLGRPPAHIGSLAFK